MKNEVWLALISAVSAIVIAYITATVGAKKAAKIVVKNETASIVRKIEKLGVVTAGAIGRDGEVIRYSGFPFTVSPRQAGIYRINFLHPFKEVPVVVAISDGGDTGAFAEVTSIDITGFTIEGRKYSDHGLALIGFQFVAVQAIKNK